MLHETLKQATAQAHNDLEQQMFVHQIMDGSLTLENYQQILLTNYKIHSCFEQQVFEQLDYNLQADLEIDKREKLSALIKDIRELGLQLPVSNSHPNININGNAAALGAMYVMEGATLGGSVIVKKLKVNPNLQQYNLGLHYYQVYGADLINRWKLFCQVLNAEVEESDYTKSTQAALALFNQFAAVQTFNPEKTLVKEA